jgi:hypothetical protein
VILQESLARLSLGPWRGRRGRGASRRAGALIGQSHKLNLPPEISRSSQHTGGIMTDQGLPRLDGQPPSWPLATTQGLRGVGVDVARGLRAASPTAVVLWEPAGYGYHEAIPGGDSRDLLVSGLLAQGWALLAGDPQTVDLPPLPGWRLVVSGHDLTLRAPQGDRLLDGVVVPPLAGWLEAVGDQGVCALIAGTDIGLRAGQPGLLAAMQAGRVVGAAAEVCPAGRSRC